MTGQSPVFKPRQFTRIKLIPIREHPQQVLGKVSIIGNHTEIGSSLGLLLLDGGFKLGLEDLFVVCPRRIGTV